MCFFTASLPELLKIVHIGFLKDNFFPFDKEETIEDKNKEQKYINKLRLFHRILELHYC